MKKYLISGLGPALMENEDLNGSLYDEKHPEIKELYSFDEKSYLPENLVYCRNGVEYPILRPKVKMKETDYISETLKSILVDANIQFSFIPIKTIWNNEKYLHNQNEPCVVCLSTTFMWNIKMINWAINWIYQNLNCHVLVIGGQYGVLKCDYIKRELSCKVNFIMTAEAELSLVPLLNYIDGDKHVAIKDIPNLWYRTESGQFAFTKYQDYQFRKNKMVTFKGNNSYIPYMSMRGCPYHCKFCALRECTPKWQYFTSERIIADWDKYAKDNGATHFSINDSTFFIPFNKIKELLALLKTRNYSWDANARADTPFDEKIVQELEQANCTALFFGFESMCDETLRKMAKLTTSEDNRRINRLFENSSIITKMSFIVGFPGETVEDFRKTQQYLINEHIGRYSLYVFEYEGDILPIAKEKELYQLELLEDEETYHWAHAGEHWKHCGMDSSTAQKLRMETIVKTRIDPNSRSVFRTWQDTFEWPYVKELSKNENMIIEKILDRIVFMPVDDLNHFQTNIKTLVTSLEDFHIKLR